MNLTDYAGNIIRLTDERISHIKEHPEMTIHAEKINETITDPDIVVRSRSDEEARLYYRHYEGLSIGNKYLCIVVKFKEADAFVVTAYFTDSIKRGDVIWKK
ncbi:MAG: PBECR2 nuclease fold domain-containing protein [Nitrospirota bacterium]